MQQNGNWKTTVRTRTNRSDSKPTLNDVVNSHLDGVGNTKVVKYD